MIIIYVDGDHQNKDPIISFIIKHREIHIKSFRVECKQPTRSKTKVTTTVVIRTHVLFVVKMNTILKARRDQVGVRSQFTTPTRDFLHFRRLRNSLLFLFNFYRDRTFVFLLLLLVLCTLHYCRNEINRL